MLNNGNIFKKSNLLKFYLSEECYESNVYEKEYAKYKESIKVIDGIRSYNKIEKYLHDAYFESFIIDNDIVITLKMWNSDTNNNIQKTLVFKNANVVSVNKVLKSGKISRINKKIKPEEYLYDEIYIENDMNYITMIVSTKNKICSGINFPLITIKFSSIGITP